MQSTEIKYILAIADCLSITEAAKKLYISQPALSKYLREREEILGTPLFQRNKNRLELTEAGKIYVEYGRKIVELENECLDKIDSILKNRKTHIAIGIPDSELHRFAQPLICFQWDNPNFEIQLVNGDTNKLLKMAHEEKLDLLIDGSGELSGELIHTAELFLYIPDRIIEKYQLSLAEPVDLRTVKDETFFFAEETNMLGFNARKAFSLAGLPLPQHTTIDGEAMHAYYEAKKRNGLAFIPVEVASFEKEHCFQFQPHFVHEVRLILCSDEAKLLKTDQLYIDDNFYI